MKKKIICMITLILVALLAFAACKRGSGDLGDKIDSGLDKVSEKVSEGVSNAGDMIRDGVTDASNALNENGRITENESESEPTSNMNGAN